MQLSGHSWQQGLVHRVLQAAASQHSCCCTAPLHVAKLPQKAGVVFYM